MHQRKETPVRHWRIPALLIVLVILGQRSISAETIQIWDFSKGTLGWTGNPKIENLKSSNAGLNFNSAGHDPWIEGPAIDLPEDVMYRVTIRMKSTADKSGELFYGKYFQAGKSAQFVVQNDGEWHDYSLVIKDRLGAATRFRLDPCGGKGNIQLAFVKVESIEKVIMPTLEKPVIPKDTQLRDSGIRSGELALRHNEKNFGGFVCDMDGYELVGYTQDVLGVTVNGKPEWLRLKDAQVTPADAEYGRRYGSVVLCITAKITDSGGGNWQIKREFTGSKHKGSIIVKTTITCDKYRGIIHAPWLTVFTGIGEQKTQALFAGVEYLSDEPSSSDADIAKPKNIRNTPPNTWITFPLMAVSNGSEYFGLIWDRSEAIAATFDSPDRIYNSGGHLMSLSGPAVGDLRFENDFASHSPLPIKANVPISVSAMIITGKGKDVTAAVRQYVSIKGLPELPGFNGGFAAAAILMSHGWLDSTINHNGLVRHAVWANNFGPGPSADAAMYMDWLSDKTSSDLPDRLIKGKVAVLSKLPPQDPFASGVGHVRRPTAPLVFGRTAEYVRMRKQQAAAALGRFDADGIMHYAKGKVDYSRTHFADHANGLSGATLVGILEAVTFCADKDLADKAIALLDKQTILYANTVPRGAQTWEMPLHTPDVLASAHMVRAYLLGHIITGRPDHLEQAKYWAWTGVPFVFLDNPTEFEVGDYSIIAVLGATNWQAPIWFGRPVQWCGLVYAASLYELSEYDSDGPWAQIAKGITLAGLQMSWPESDEARQGLLPDFFFLPEQVRDGPAINPGTIQAKLAECFNEGSIYDIKKLNKRGWFIHAPCSITDITEKQDEIIFTSDGWGDKDHNVLISGIGNKPAEVLGQRPAEPLIPLEHEYHDTDGLLIIKAKGETKIHIR